MLSKSAIGAALSYGLDLIKVITSIKETVRSSDRAISFIAQAISV